MAAAPPQNQLSLKGNEFTAWVSVGNVQTDVYKIRSKEDRTRGYIEAVEDAPFGVHFKDNQPDPKTGIKITLYIDGNRITSINRSQNDYRYEKPLEHHKRILTIDDIRRGNETKILTFGKLRTTDDELKATNSDDYLKNVSIIRLEIHRIDNEREIPRSALKGGKRGAAEWDSFPEEKVILETTKKLVSHQTSFGPSMPRPGPPRTDDGPSMVRKYDQIDVHKPWFIFEFKYLSKAMLELNGVIPSSNPDSTFSRPFNPRNPSIDLRSEKASSLPPPYTAVAPASSYPPGCSASRAPSYDPFHPFLTYKAPPPPSDLVPADLAIRGSAKLQRPSPIPVSNPASSSSKDVLKSSTSSTSSLKRSASALDLPSDTIYLSSDDEEETAEKEKGGGEDLEEDEDKKDAQAIKDAQLKFRLEAELADLKKRKEERAAKRVKREKEKEDRKPVLVKREDGVEVIEIEDDEDSDG